GLRRDELAAVARRFLHLLPDLGVDRAGDDQVDLDAAVDEVGGEHLAPPAHGELRRGVRGLSRASDPAGHAADVHDAALLSLEHLVEQLLPARCGDHRGAALREVERDGLPDPGRRAGDDRDLAAVVEAHAAAYRSRRICAMRSRWKDASPNATSDAFARLKYR